MKKKISMLFFIFIILILLNVNTCFAMEKEHVIEINGKGIEVAGTSIKPNDYKPPNFTEKKETLDMANKIIGAFQAIGSIVSVIALVLVGIKYMTGSVEEKAEYKQTMMYYIIGAILVFAISNISAMIYSFSKTLW